LEPREPLHSVGRAALNADGFRFAWNDEASFDFNRDVLRWLPGSTWKGHMPTSFYSSVAAMTAASMGMLPLHVSSIVMGDKAWLIAGKAGAGKSTLVAELLGAGAQLLADDLTVIASLDGHVMATRGRPSIRLHPQSAEQLSAVKVEPVPEDKRGKLLVWPKARAEDKSWPIGGALLLGGNCEQAISTPQKAAAYGSLIFRPKILAKLPGHAERKRMILDMARHVPAVRLPAADYFGDADRDIRIEAALRVIRTMSGPA
jgi:hypothetical protein